MKLSSSSPSPSMSGYRCCLLCLALLLALSGSNSRWLVAAGRSPTWARQTGRADNERADAGSGDNSGKGKAGIEGKISPRASPQQCEDGARNVTAATSAVGKGGSKNSIGDGLVHELGIGNFASVLGESTVTFILFYDGNLAKKSPITHAARAYQDKRKVLARLASEFANARQPKSFFLRDLKIRFGAIDIRRHYCMRIQYLRWPDAEQSWEAYEKLHRDYDDLDDEDSEVPETMIGSETFLSLPFDQLPDMTSSGGEWALLQGGMGYNLLNCIDSEERLKDGETTVDPVNYDHVREWLVRQIQERAHYSLANNRPRPPAAILSQISKEKNAREEYLNKDPMDSIDWDKAKEYSEERKRRDTYDAARSSTNPYRIDNAPGNSDNFFKYIMEDGDSGTDGEIMNSLSKIVSVYLAWSDSYENLWDEGRRVLEDERTNYGQYLRQMNDQLRDTLFSAFDDLREEGSNEEGEASPLLLSQEDVPNLERYFEEMLFGYGRSTTSLKSYLEEHVYPFTADEISGIDLLERIREYMRVREEVGVREPYTTFFRNVCVRIYSILSDFQANLARHYVGYLQAHPDEREQQENGGYGFSAMTVYDMKDQATEILLTDYDEIQRRHIIQRKPYILSNVEMTKPYNFTLEHLIEKCGFVDVTRDVKESMRLGDRSVKGWGGLKDYKLPQELMSGGRRDLNDKSLSLEQFLELTKYIDNIYLHDFSVRKQCTSLLWEESPYDPPEQQYFHIPAVIGRYDFIQRLPDSSFINSWPSLFIGRKGSNSKLHIDAGGTGFWMFLVSGRKRWVIYEEAERPYLYERMQSPSFIADVLSLNATQDKEEQRDIDKYFDATYPLLRRANGYEIIQEPGQLVYIPQNSPHAVENLEDIVGLSFNQVPREGITHHLFNMIHKERDFGSLEIAFRYLLSERKRRFALVDEDVSDVLYTTLGAYIEQ